MQRLHGQTSVGGHDLNAVDLAVAVRVPLELRVARRVTGVLNPPAVSHALQKCLPQAEAPPGYGAGAQAGDVLTGIIDELAVAAALATDCKHRGTAGPVRLHPLRSRHAPQRPK